MRAQTCDYVLIILSFFQNDSDETTDNDDHFDPTYGPGSDSEALEDEFETVKAVEVIKERPKLFQSTPAPVPVAFTPPATSSDKTFRRVVSQPASGERPGGYESGDTSDEENLEPEARIRKRMSRVLNYARKGERRPCRCFHPSCSSKAVYTQRLLRHYMEVHGGREGISKVQAEKLLKQHQPSDLGKVRHMVKERSIIKHLAPLSENKDLLMRLRAFFEEENIAVIKDPKSNGKRTEAVRPPVSPAANEDPLTDEEVVSDISPEALGLNAHCAKTHVLLKLFIEEKSKAAAGAADPKMATANMAGFVSRIISFVESRVKDKKDAFEVLRHPEIHQELINRILKCSLKNAGKANFKRAMDTLIRYCTSGTGPHGQACLTVHPAFPKNDADLTEAIAKVAVIWGRFKAAAPSLTQTHDIADINIDLTDYGEYFTEEARYQKVLQDIETLTSKTADPSNWMKGTNGRYDPEISEGYNAAMRYIAVLLVWKGERGGVATSMTMSELEKANFLEEDELWHVRVAVHKNQKQGPLDVFLTDDEALLFNAFYQLRQRLKMMDESHFASDVLLVGLDGQPGKHIYTDIQKWYDEKKGEATSSKPKFSSRSVRRTQAANAKRFHSKETFSKVARHHNHLESTAESDYVGRSSREAVEDYKTNENVVLNELIAKEAIENSSEWFQFKSATQPLPSRDNVEAVCIAMTKHDSRHFALSTKRYEAILTALKRNLKISTFKWLKRRLRHSKCSMEEALNFLKHDCTLSTDRKITIDFEKYLLESQQPSGKRSNKKIKSEKE
ncbi:hypothetical protein ONE63_005108 [Megalurothrips usitatus]|uniref:C2H2-type domain-containing protein n=1 Tax=Megalurothrips usitatus TaxID=439358 RepID=A0AAV7XYH2_9NEOP|nr:hypothetical protein ONE63_005108 [Megalurothrips usitatus]